MSAKRQFGLVLGLAAIAYVFVLTLVWPLVIFVSLTSVAIGVPLIAIIFRPEVMMRVDLKRVLVIVFAGFTLVLSALVIIVTTGYLYEEYLGSGWFLGQLIVYRTQPTFMSLLPTVEQLFLLGSVFCVCLWWIRREFHSLKKMKISQ